LLGFYRLCEEKGGEMGKKTEKEIKIPKPIQEYLDELKKDGRYCKDLWGKTWSIADVTDLITS
jgi:hypothetical protein